jgi:hypothetical protein
MTTIKVLRDYRSWERGYCASVERGAGSGDFESGERGL